MIYVSSDWHLCPNERELFPEAIEFLKRAKEDNASIIINGDFLNILPYGTEAWSPESPSVKAFIEVLGEYNAIIVEGNHDPYLLLFNILLSYPNLFVVGAYTGMTFKTRRWWFYHGYQRSDWAIWKLVAPQFVEYMVKWHPRFWHWICTKLGWFPGYGSSNGESERLNLIIAGIQHAWERWAEKQECNICIGHTHKAKQSTIWRKQRGCYLFIPESSTLLDTGNLRDGSYGIIDDEGRGEIHWL